MAAGEIETCYDSLLVSGDKVFFSLQGEGPSLGKPAVFLRLHLCNLRCAWCDTKYTWIKGAKSRYDQPERWSITRAWERISQYPAGRVVITGGEPLLQPRALDGLIGLLPAGWQVEIETNGTLLPTELMVERGVQFNVSPKLANSGQEKARRYRPEALISFNRLREVTFKFVVMAEADLREVEEVVEECGLAGDRVIVMPEGVTQRAIVSHGRVAAALCKEKGWRLMPRLQVMLWGRRRGT